MTHRKILLGFVLLSMAKITIAVDEKTCHSKSVTNITPLIELYTSEGCSSCPPADRWLSKQIADNKLNANFIALHVDYWDSIGWPDRFAKPAYTRRQLSRVQQQNSNTVYTPQVMLDTDTRISWHTPGKVKDAVNKLNHTAAPVQINLSADGADEQWRAQVAFVAQPLPRNANWYLALYQDGLSTQVKAGENRGALLRHDRVLQRWYGPHTLSDLANRKDFNIILPSRDYGQYGLLAWVENANTGAILQSLSLPLAACAKGLHSR